jgi:phage terminase small subunit
MTQNIDLKGVKSGRELVKLLVENYNIQQGVGRVLAQVAGQALDQALEAEAIIKARGLVVMGERGLRANPACSISRDARNRMLSALAKLNLEL